MSLWISLVYGIDVALLLTGAVLGARAGSRISLVMGLASAAVMAAGWVLTRCDARLGHGLVALMSLVLAGIFTLRFLKTAAFMPAGLMCLASVAVLIVAVSACLRGGMIE